LNSHFRRIEDFRRQTWPKRRAPTRCAIQVYRWKPDDGKESELDTYHVDVIDCGPMVLDGLIWIKNHNRPDATFRRSCAKCLRLPAREHRRPEHAGLHK